MLRTLHRFEACGTVRRDEERILALRRFWAELRNVSSGRRRRSAELEVRVERGSVSQILLERPRGVAVVPVPAAEEGSTGQHAFVKDFRIVGSERRVSVSSDGRSIWEPTEGSTSYLVR